MVLKGSQYPQAGGTVLTDTSGGGKGIQSDGLKELERKASGGIIIPLRISEFTPTNGAYTHRELAQGQKRYRVCILELAVADAALTTQTVFTFQNDGPAGDIIWQELFEAAAPVGTRKGFVIPIDSALLFDTGSGLYISAPAGGAGSRFLVNISGRIF